jgi:hypothetical protein
MRHAAAPARRLVSGTETAADLIARLAVCRALPRFVNPLSREAVRGEGLRRSPEPVFGANR